MKSERRPPIELKFTDNAILYQGNFQADHPLAKNMVSRHIEKAQRGDTNKFNIIVTLANRAGQLFLSNEKLQSEEYQSQEGKEQLVNTIFSNIDESSRIFIHNSLTYGTNRNKGEQINYISVKNPTWDEAAEIVRFSRNKRNVLLECYRRSGKTHDIIAGGIYAPSRFPDNEYDRLFEELMDTIVVKIDPYEEIQADEIESSSVTIKRF